MQQLSDVVFILVLLSSGLLALSGLKTFLGDLSARRGEAGRERGGRPDRADLAIDLAMTLGGAAGAVGALRGLGAF